METLELENLTKKIVDSIIQKCHPESELEMKKILVSIQNIMEVIEERPYLIRETESKNVIIGELVDKLLLMYASNKKIVDIDKSIIFEVVNSVRGVPHNVIGSIVEDFSKPEFNQPLIEFNKNPINNKSEIIRIIANDFSQNYISLINKKDYLNTFMENQNKRLSSILVEVKKESDMLKYNFEKYGSADPIWREKYSSLAESISELDNMSPFNVKRYLEMKLYLNALNRNKDKVTLRDSMVLIKIASLIDISGLSDNDIDKLIGDVYKLDPSLYAEALGVEVKKSSK